MRPEMREEVDFTKGSIIVRGKLGFSSSTCFRDCGQRRASGDSLFAGPLRAVERHPLL
jgi:hypothetical protein